MKKLFKILTIIIFVILISGCKKNEEKKLNIVALNFPSYDFARAITKNIDNINLQMLLKPGEETHTFEPTPKDIINIEKSDVFIYTGGESDEWVESIIKDINKDAKIIKLMDIVDLKEEELIEGMEGEIEKEYDEHVWTSPINAIEIIQEITKKIIEKDETNKEIYIENSNNYINQIRQIDQDIRKIVNSSKRKELIFADRFPLRYFTSEYGILYYAAFKGCSEATEASAKTIKFLIDKVKKDSIPVVLKIELSNGKLANQIANETKTKVLEFSSAHNITKREFEEGKTYIDIMKQNEKVLEEALN